MQYWTPNKYIYEFGYANEVALEECRKRNIDVMFGWEMTEVKRTDVGEKVAIFRNVDTNEVIEKSFFTAMINPPSTPHSFLTEVPNMCDNRGGVDINKYTMQLINRANKAAPSPDLALALDMLKHTTE